MKNERVLYLIASSMFALLAVGYTVVVFVDFYLGYTPQYLTALHILTGVLSYAAAIVNFLRYRKHG